MWLLALIWYTILHMSLHTEQQAAAMCDTVVHVQSSAQACLWRSRWQC